MRYIIGLLIITLGIVLIIKTEWFIQNFGNSRWAEEHFGYNGGTRILYKVIGLFMIFLSFMGITGLLGPAILSIFGRLFGLK